MARYVLLEFDDDAKADAYVSRITAAGKVGIRLVGLFARPTRWCGCPHPEGYAKNQLARGAKYGWWVCVICRRPRMGTHQLENLVAPQDQPLSHTEITYRPTALSIFEVFTERFVRH